MTSFFVDDGCVDCPCWAQLCRHGALSVRDCRPPHPHLWPRADVPVQVRARDHDGSDAVRGAVSVFRDARHAHLHVPPHDAPRLLRMRHAHLADRTSRAQRHEEPVCVRDTKFAYVVASRAALVPRRSQRNDNSMGQRAQAVTPPTSTAFFEEFVFGDTTEGAVIRCQLSSKARLRWPSANSELVESPHTCVASALVAQSLYPVFSCGHHAPRPRDDCRPHNRRSAA